MSVIGIFQQVASGGFVEQPLDGLMVWPEETHPSLAELRKVEIRELYRDYTPPVDATAIVNQLLRTVPDKYLQGLSCVVLTNETGLSRKDRLGKVWSRKRKYDKSRVIGRYHPGSRSSRPYIELRVDDHQRPGGNASSHSIPPQKLSSVR